MSTSKLNLVFVLDPYEQLYWQEDTSCTIMAESCRREHAVFGLQMGSLVMDQNRLWAKVNRLSVSLKTGIRLEEKDLRIDLGKVDVIFVRKEPPFDSEYLYLTHLLDLIAHQTFVLNSPEGLRWANEK